MTSKSFHLEHSQEFSILLGLLLYLSSLKMEDPHLFQKEVIGVEFCVKDLLVTLGWKVDSRRLKKKVVDGLKILNFTSLSISNKKVITYMNLFHSLQIYQKGKIKIKINIETFNLLTDSTGMVELNSTFLSNIYKAHMQKFRQGGEGHLAYWGYPLFFSLKQSLTNKVLFNGVIPIDKKSLASLVLTTQWFCSDYFVTNHLVKKKPEIVKTNSELLVTFRDGNFCLPFNSSAEIRKSQLETYNNSTFSDQVKDLFPIKKDS